MQAFYTGAILISKQNVEVVKRVVAALNERNVPGYLACCTEDVRLQTPAGPLGDYEGQVAIRRWFEDLADTSPDFRLTIDSVEPLGASRVLASMRVTSTGRASGIPVFSDRPITNIYDLVAGRISCIRVFLDPQEALKAVGLGE